jgi:hypothetical protein
VGYGVAQLVVALRYKLEGQGFASQSAVSCGRVRSICSERAALEECRFVLCVFVCLYTSMCES